MFKEEALTAIIILLVMVIIIISVFIYYQIRNLQIYDEANENQLKNLTSHINYNNKVIAKNNPNITYQD